MSVKTSSKDASEIARLVSENERLYAKLDKINAERREKEEWQRLMKKERQQSKDRKAVRVMVAIAGGTILSGIVAGFKSLDGLATLQSFAAATILVYVASLFIKPE